MNVMRTIGQEKVILPEKFRHAMTNPLTPIQEEFMNFDLSKHVFIEGENLDALEVLQRSQQFPLSLKLPTIAHFGAYC